MRLSFAISTVFFAFFGFLSIPLARAQVSPSPLVIEYACSDGSGAQGQMTTDSCIPPVGDRDGYICYFGELVETDLGIHNLAVSLLLETNLFEGTNRNNISNSKLPSRNSFCLLAAAVGFQGESPLLQHAHLAGVEGHSNNQSYATLEDCGLKVEFGKIFQLRGTVYPLPGPWIENDALVCDLQVKKRS
jgi:hypothetical protein